MFSRVSPPPPEFAACSANQEHKSNLMVIGLLLVGYDKSSDKWLENNYHAQHSQPLS